MQFDQTIFEGVFFALFDLEYFIKMGVGGRHVFFSVNDNV
jgi:hypothetical protein